MNTIRLNFNVPRLHEQIEGANAALAEKNRAAAREAVDASHQENKFGMTNFFSNFTARQDIDRAGSEAEPTIRAGGTEVTSNDDRPETYKAMAQIVHSLGWDRVEVLGSPDFVQAVNEYFNNAYTVEAPTLAANRNTEAPDQIPQELDQTPPQSGVTAAEPAQREGNWISFDRELSEKRAQNLRDNAFVRDRVNQLRGAGVGPAATPTQVAPGQPAPAPALDAAAKPQADQAAVSQAELEARSRALQAVLKRYLKVKDEYKLKDPANTTAFRDKGDKLVTKHHDPEIARSMVDLAIAKGWDCLKIGGSKEFKAEVWLYAAARGLDVAGYKPSELDKAKLAELTDDVMKAAHVPTAAAAGSPQKEAANEPAVNPATVKPDQVQVAVATSEVAPPLTPRHEAALSAMETILRRPSAQYPNGHTAAQIEAAQTAARKQWTTDRVYVGRVTEHGPANYEFKPEGSQNYFVKLEDPKGNKFTLWGVDLRRAFEGSHIRPDDDLVFAFKGTQKVTAPVTETAPDGSRKTEYALVDRNTWEVTPMRTMTPEKAQAARELAKRTEGPNLAASLAIQAKAPTKAHQPPVRQFTQGRGGR